MELYAAAGMEFVRELSGEGKQVFLDMKFYDIGETVKRAVAQVARAGVRFLTVHGSGAVMRAAVEGRGGIALAAAGRYGAHQLRPERSGRPGLPLRGFRTWWRCACARRWRPAVDGIVCSPLEAASVREITGPGDRAGDAGSALGRGGQGRSEARGHAGGSDCERRRLPGDRAAGDPRPKIRRPKRAGFWKRYRLRRNANVA